jgi:hypothetical protein
LALLGHDLTFHHRQSYFDYTKTVREVVGAIGKPELDSDSAPLLLESRAPEIIANYLSVLFLREQPVADLSKYAPDVAAMETRLTAALQRIGVSTRGMPTAVDSRHDMPTRQLKLLPEENLGSPAGLDAIIPYPANVKKTVVNGSQTVAAVLWSLAALRAQGREWCTGAEITRLMNQHVFSDHEKKEPTNISRALRGKTLRAQKWLAVAGNKGGWLYGLSDSWRDEWQAIFGQAAPSIVR